MQHLYNSQIRIHKFCEKYDISYASDWDELIDNLYEKNVIIGEIIDVETI